MFRIITEKNEVKCLLNNQVQAAIVFEIKAFACLGLSVLSSVALFVASFHEIALNPRRNQFFFHFFAVKINFSSTLLKICQSRPKGMCAVCPGRLIGQSWKLWFESLFVAFVKILHKLFLWIVTRMLRCIWHSGLRVYVSTKVTKEHILLCLAL